MRLLLSTRIFGDLTPAELAPLAQAATRRTYRRGEYVERIGQRVNGLIVIASGHFKDTTDSADGRENIYELYWPGTTFGEPAIFADGRDRMVNLVALDTSSVLYIDRDYLIRFLFAHPPAMLGMLRELADECRAVVRIIDGAAFSDIRQRLLTALVDLAGKRGTPSPRGTRIDFPLTHDLLAAYVQASRANITRAIADLTATGHISVQGKTYTVRHQAQ